MAGCGAVGVFKDVGAERVVPAAFTIEAYVGGVSDSLGFPDVAACDAAGVCWMVKAADEADFLV